MKRFTDPLDNIRVASPCKADWDQMYGNERKRFCAECRLNVYNLSDMRKEEAERLLLESEGSLCVRFFRRSDGTVLTRNCPVGWQAVKHRISRVAAAAFSIAAGFMAGAASVVLPERYISRLPIGNIPRVEIPAEPAVLDVDPVPEAGEVDRNYEVEGRVDVTEFRRKHYQKSRNIRAYVVRGRTDLTE